MRCAGIVACDYPNLLRHFRLTAKDVHGFAGDAAPRPAVLIRAAVESCDVESCGVTRSATDLAAKNKRERIPFITQRADTFASLSHMCLCPRKLNRRKARGGEKQRQGLDRGNRKYAVTKAKMGTFSCFQNQKGTKYGI